jgi:hypothetical protein
MAVIHHTTLTPTKLELLTGWLPEQPWYVRTGRGPELAKAGGFRLDDPRGEVGIEFMVVTDGLTSYQVPLTYRGAPLDRGDGLIGTAEHGVLGRRWIYDGLHDPVLVEQLVALIQGTAPAQAQSQSDTPDPTVRGYPVTGEPLATTGFSVAPDGAGLDVGTVMAGDARRLVIRLHRTLRPDDAAALGGAGVTATWRLPDGTEARGVFATAQLAE